jgi:hypothetical protein
MAGVDAIRDVTDTLIYLLRAGIPAAVVDPTRITVRIPDEFEPLRHPVQPNITVFLYRISVNPQMRNGPRRLLPDGSSTRPLLPLELNYLVTAWAPDARDELRIIGRILQILYDRGELGAADLQGTSWENGDTAQVILESLPLEDHYRIWDAGEVPYRLSLTYLVRIIEMSPSEAIAKPPVVEAFFGQGPKA